VLNERREARPWATILAPVVLDPMELQEPPDPTWIQVLPLNDELVVLPVIHEARHLARKMLPRSTAAQRTHDVQEALQRHLAEPRTSLPVD
jgi:hypothetical protein